MNYIPIYVVVFLKSTEGYQMKSQSPALLSPLIPFSKGYKHNSSFPGSFA